jgi:membrane glycosyltransferase
VGLFALSLVAAIVADVLPAGFPNTMAVLFLVSFCAVFAGAATAVMSFLGMMRP